MELITRCRDAFLEAYARQGFSLCHIFLSASDMKHRAIVRSATDKDPETAFTKACEKLSSGLGDMQPTILRADWVVRAIPAIWQDFLERIKGRRQGLWRQGIAFGENFDFPFTEQELNARGLLIPAPKEEKEEDTKEEKRNGKGKKEKESGERDARNMCGVNDAKWIAYCRERHGKEWVPIGYTHRIWIFSTCGVFVQEGEEARPLIGKGIHAGRREIRDIDTVSMIRSCSSWLARHNSEPSFERAYALYSAFEKTGDAEIEEAFRTSLDEAVRERLHTYTHGGRTCLFVGKKDAQVFELGSSALALLLLQKCAVHTDLLPALLNGLRIFRREDHIFSHLLNRDDLSPKETFCSADYDGLAICALLAMGEEEAAIESFDALGKMGRWQFHTVEFLHAANMINAISSTQERMLYAVNSFFGAVSAIFLNTIPNPSYLRLMLAGDTTMRMVEREPEIADQVDLGRFSAALKGRVGYLLDSYFWPELAMYCDTPEEHLGTFFRRDQNFASMPDDVAAFLLCLTEYADYQKRPPLPCPPKKDVPSPADPIETFKERLSECNGTLYCLFDGLPLYPDGLKISALRRAELFHKYLSNNICILTHIYQNTLFELFVENCKLKRLSEATYMNMYDAFQGINRNKLPPAPIDLPKAFGKRRIIAVPDKPDFIVTNTGKAGTLYLVVDPRNKKLRAIKYLDKKGKEFQREHYDTYGFMSRRDVIDKNGKVTQSTFHRADKASSVAVREQYDENGKLTRMELIGLDNTVYATFTDMRDAIQYWFRLLTNDPSRTFVVIGDNREEYIQVFKQGRIKGHFENCRFIQVIHNNTIGVEYLVNGDDDYMTLPTGELYNFLYDFGVRCDRIVTLTERQKQHYEERYGLSNISVIPHAFPVPEEKSREEKDYDPFMVIHVGRLCDQKCHEQAIEVFKLVVREIPQAVLHFYGVGGLNSRLQQRVQHEGLEKNIRFEGFSTEMDAVYDRAACMIVTSTFEGFSLVSIESVSHGCPVVTMDCDYGPASIIEDGVNGFVTPLGDVQAMAEKIIEILRHPDLRQEFSRNCAKSIEKFTEPVVSRKWAEMLTQLLPAVSE